MAKLLMVALFMILFLKAGAIKDCGKLSKRICRAAGIKDPRLRGTCRLTVSSACAANGLISSFRRRQACSLVVVDLCVSKDPNVCGTYDDCKLLQKYCGNLGKKILKCGAIHGVNPCCAQCYTGGPPVRGCYRLGWLHEETRLPISESGCDTFGSGDCSKQAAPECLNLC